MTDMYKSNIIQKNNESTTTINTSHTIRNIQPTFNKSVVKLWELSIQYFSKYSYTQEYSISLFIKFWNSIIYDLLTVDLNKLRKYLLIIGCLNCKEFHQLIQNHNVAN